MWQAIGKSPSNNFYWNTLKGVMIKTVNQGPNDESVAIVFVPDEYWNAETMRFEPSPQSGNQQLHDASL